MKLPFHHISRSFVVAVFVITSTLLSPLFTTLHASAAVPRILVLNSYNIGYDWWEDEMTELRDGLSRVYPRLDLYLEHLDTKKFHSKKHFPYLAELLTAKYANLQLDLIIAMDNAALEFATRYRHRVSPGTPLIFCGINNYEPAMIAGQKLITGVAEYHDSMGTLELALKLHPAARNIIAIHDYTDTGLAIRRELEESSQHFPEVRLRFMEEMPLEETVKRLKTITPDYLVLMLSYTVEKGGRTFSHSEAARLVSEASPVPVYSVYAAQLGNGVVGGRMVEGQTQGLKAAELAVSIINGEHPDKLPVVTSNLSRPMFDDRVLRRFGIDPARLPADAVIINKPPSTFAINKKAFWLGSAFTLFCIIGLTVLFFNIRRRKLLEEMLRLKIDQYQESQEELQATEEILRAQVDEFMQSQDELQATEEMLREQISEYQTTHDQLQDTKEKLRIQLEVAEESSQKFRAVFEYSPITVALTTLPEGTFSEVNQAFIDMFGYSRDEAIGRTTVELGVWLHEPDRERYLQLLKANGHVYNFETEMRRKPGEVFSVLFSGVQLEIAGKSSVLSAVMEITEQKRLQNQLLQAQKMDVVGQLAGGIAHDFNNMLAGIMAAAELLKRRLEHDDKNSKLAATIIEAATRSADLTSELLTFSRKGTAVSSPIRINDTIIAVMSLLKRTIDKQIQLTSRLDQGNPVIMGDQTQLQNALLNLGVNARDAMSQGGTLTYATTVKTLDEASFHSMGISRAAGRYLEITVSDTGDGMTNQVLQHIFEPFFTTKGVGKGTGLGLASVYGAVKSHGGEISVQSQPGAGSVFRIFLPLVSGDPNRQNIPDEAVGGSGGILLVDDEEMLRSVGRDLLEDLGYTVFLAKNGEQALQVFDAHREEISLVILDMIMPKMGGKEVFLRLREQSPDLKVLFCSGFSREGTGDELVGLGANGFIQKPYNRNDLSRKVSEVLGSA
ncbi:MAG: hypothetical protein A2X85_11800 [Geobacteraceae bacterium GWF2_54_21]|nr:MAG: hypothetical protein A2X85_11800 [Geobacteraceae bacterium GWF2_54_21]